MSGNQFRRRPLSRSVRDRRLWVEPPRFAQLLRAIELDFNMLIVGPAGAGVTTTLNRLAAVVEDRGVGVVLVSAGDVDSSTMLLDRVADGIDGADDQTESSSATRALGRLQSVAVQHPGLLVVIDDLVGAVGHDVFGRMRDELWEIPVHWLVGANADHAAVLLKPPADGFFETAEQLEPFSAEKIVDLLAHRDLDGEFDTSLREQIAAQSQGNPSRALATARRLLLLPPADRAGALVSDPIAEVEQRLGQPAARLYAELLRHGPSGPSDGSLRARIGWSRPRAYQVFQDLEREGLVRATSERSGTAGRPRKVYEVIEA